VSQALGGMPMIRRTHLQQYQPLQKDRLVLSASQWVTHYRGNLSLKKLNIMLTKRHKPFFFNNKAIEAGLRV
jgi:hypothetical protein